MAELGNLASHLQRLPETDRRTFLENILALWLEAGNLERVLEYLKSDAFLHAKVTELDWDPLKIVEDFLKSYPAFRDADQILARRLLERFLAYLFKHQRQFDINDVFVWLQPFAHSQLLHDAVELIASGQWFLADADPKEIKRFELKCRRSRTTCGGGNADMPKPTANFGALWKNGVLSILKNCKSYRSWNTR